MMTLGFALSFCMSSSLRVDVTWPLPPHSGQALRRNGRRLGARSGFFQQGPGSDLLAILLEVRPDRAKLRDVTVGTDLPFFGDQVGLARSYLQAVNKKARLSLRPRLRKSRP